MISPVMANVFPDEVREACRMLGWSGLRPAQVQVLEPLLSGRDVIAVLPTSAGKSATFQIPALVRPGLVIVVSPLIALMVDQVLRLEALGVPAAALHSSLTTSERKRTMDRIREGSLKILYCSPERLQGLDARFFSGLNLQMFAVDEAHCISEWGHDFRPAYVRLGQSLQRIAGGQRVQTLALTATATSEVIEEVATLLRIPDATRIVHSPDRSNIFYGVVGHQVDLLRMVGRAEDLAGLPCLVYGSTRRSVEVAAEELRRAGLRAAHYHGEMNREERMRVQADFGAGRLQVITATCAFGMGIDNRDLRAVVHLEMPTSLEAYIQEAGRAGRDGAPSVAICRATMETLSVARSIAEATWPSPSRIRQFWHLIAPLYAGSSARWDAAEEASVTTADLVRQTGFSDLEVGACVRILVDAGSLAKVAHLDRPARVSLLSPAFELRGSRQREVIAALQDAADADGEVTGSIAFFRDEIGLDKSYAEDLRRVGAVRFDWAEPGMLLRRARPRPEFDATRVQALLRRALARIDRAQGYLSTPGCRRSYLLETFGAGRSDVPARTCCDRCMRLDRIVS